MTKKSEQKRRSGGITGPEWRYEEKRSKAITFTVTPTQFEAFQAAAKECVPPVTVSSWVLQAALNALPKKKAEEIGTPA